VPIPAVARRAYRRLSRRTASDASFYGRGYFEGAGRRREISGYGGYTRASSNADVAAYLLWRFMPFTTSLDLGCAKGYVVDALLELGYDSYGCDVSEWAISESPPATRGRLSALNLEKRFPRSVRKRRYSLITAFEVLEHLHPDEAPGALARLRSICNGYLVATIPSLGANASGPGGFPDGKVQTNRLDHYRALGLDYDGPVPHDDLARDANGNPAEGHLCIASFRWWTQQFENAGFRRVPSRELAMHPVIGRFDLSAAWNLYVFRVDSFEPADPPMRSDEEIAELEQRWDLARRPLGPEARPYVEVSMGSEWVGAIEAEYEASQRRASRLGAK
jgi:hypothetical protein